MVKWAAVILLVMGSLFPAFPAHSEAAGQEKLKAAKTDFRVCAAPDNLPFSNSSGQGFDNKITELLAKAEGKPLVYDWYPERRGFVSQTLGRWNCDVVLGVPAGYELTATTDPYYCSSYVVVSRSGNDVQSLFEHPASPKRIGVVERTPPLDLVLRQHIDPLVYFTNYENGKDYPGRIIDDVAAGRTDAALVWGPVGGYFAAREEPQLKVEPLRTSPDSGLRMIFPISMGVRHGDKARLAELNALIHAHLREIEAILTAYGVPLVRDDAQCLSARKEAQDVSPAESATLQLAAAAQAPNAASAGERIHCNGSVTLEGIKGVGAGEPPGPPPFTVKNGQADEKTYVGWTRFAAFCERCHGPSAVGSAIAPNLVKAIETLNKKQFETILTCGLTGNIGAGVMPAWGDNPNIMPYTDNLWAYLKARAEGGLPPGRPNKLEAKKGSE